MIVFRRLSNIEILNMINNSNGEEEHVKGKNTFKYENNISYKHFFLFAQHAACYKKNDSVIGEYIIPNNIINQKGFGLYRNICSTRNIQLYGYQMPIPEIIIKESDFKKEYLYKLVTNINDSLITKTLDNNDNEKFNEKKEEYFGNIDLEYLWYSYADVYYELLCKLTSENNMDINKVLTILQNMNLYEEIKNYYDSNKDYLNHKAEEYTKRFIKTP